MKRQEGQFYQYYHYFVAVKVMLQQNSLLVNEQLNVIRADDGQPLSDIWAIGDAAVSTKERLPATAQGKQVGFFVLLRGDNGVYL